MKTNKSYYVMIVLATIAAVAIAAATYLFGQNQQLAKGGSKARLEIPISPASQEEFSDQQVADIELPTTAPTPKAAPTSVVVFEASGSIPSVDKAQLMERVVEPFNDYYRDQYPDGYLVSLSIGKNTGASQSTYPYSASAIFKNGGNNGFLISRSEGSIAWWVPDCMKCEFTPQFSAKYPDIVKNFN